MFDVANLVSDAMRAIERRDGPFLHSGGLKFNASFILGGQIAGESMRLFRLYAEGNFIEAGSDTPFLQTGEAKYGKPILDLAVTSSARAPARALERPATTDRTTRRARGSRQHSGRRFPRS